MTKPLIQSVDAQFVQYTTPLPFATVQMRLDAEVRKAEVLASNPISRENLSSPEKFINSIQNVTRGNDFLYFAEYTYHPFLRVLSGDPTVPSLVSYTIGNPLIARYILERYPPAGVFVPLRIILQEHQVKEGGKARPESGKHSSPTTSISYYLPSSLVPSHILNADSALKAILRDLDKRLERLILVILRDSPVPSRL